MRRKKKYFTEDGLSIEEFELMLRAQQSELSIDLQGRTSIRQIFP
jgi:hypothetical protein